MNEPLIREIAQLMQQWGVGTVGTDIFIGELPQGITEGLLMIYAPSPNPHAYIDTEYVIIDFWYRAPGTSEALKKLRDIYNLLHRRHHYTTTNWLVEFSQAIGNINDVDRDREGGKLLRLSIQFICRNLNNVS